ncbi:hypothetical protein CWN85_04820 [Vibrio splendidus]|uniref:hypothetical protein n=1 Tax=Vibrio splendidus TaxID=29497 RepID=UPI000D3DAAAD|nr:hypothetical protein [Vibrio splendidus]PTP08175.1 hypothetical protein CWN86_08685 [Vibrio splendidus]PTP25306.1 hypothetical protein CWN85_04820 [Vibrio splendidus]
MDGNIDNLIENSKFMDYIRSIGIETSEVKDAILNEFSRAEIEWFVNSSCNVLSPNIYAENLVFKKVSSFLYKEYADSVIFEGLGRIDLRTMIATSASQINRPNVELPSEAQQGFKDFYHEDKFVRLSRFERQFIPERFGANERSKTFVLLEGLLLNEVETNPLFNFPNTDSIWSNEFCLGIPTMQGLRTNFNSVESSCVIWINSDFLELMGLRLDHYTNGLRALNQKGEVVLKYRYWKEELIGNGASFVGQDANIPKLEGCDLGIREDYFLTLRNTLPKLFCYTYIISS